MAVPKSRIRLQDIAASTGFSANTVSLALRRSPRIPPETREAILQAARKLGYVPNQVAQALVSRRTQTIGVVLTDITSPVLTLAARAIERELSARGYSMMLAASDNVLAKEIGALDMFRSRQVDGILIYPSLHRGLDHIRPLRAAGYPIVLLVADPDAGVDVVTMDERRGAMKVTRHLLERGHRRICFLDDSHLLGNFEKSEGYQHALRDFGLAADPALLVSTGGHDAAHGFAAMPVVMRAENRPTALLASNDSLAIGAMAWCLRNGVAIPGDLAIASFDDTEAARFAAVPITSVRYAADTVSRLAVGCLMRLIGAPEALPPTETILIEPELIVRQSTA